jgi:hypothetical protein
MWGFVSPPAYQSYSAPLVQTVGNFPHMGDRKGAGVKLLKRAAAIMGPIAVALAAGVAYHKFP